jgi:flagellin
MSVINTNAKAMLAQNALTTNNRSLSTSMEQLSTGKRINSAQDDAAGFAIAQKMTSQIRGLNQAVRNAGDAISLVQTAEGALVEVNNMLQRMRELSVQSATDSNVTTDREALNNEFNQLRLEINRVATNTQWNGRNILDKGFTGNGSGANSGLYKFQVGANANQTIDLTIGNYTTNSADQGTTTEVKTTTNATGPGHANPAAQISTLKITGTPAIGDAITVTVGDKSYTHKVVPGNGAVQTKDEIATAILAGLGGANGITGITASVTNDTLTFTAAANGTPFGISSSDGGLLGNIRTSEIATQSGANSAISALDAALKTVNTGRAEMGATMNRLQYASDNLANISTNTAESRSRIQDTDYASATTELARSQIIQQAATAMLAQANQSGQSVLALLK